MAPKTPPGLIFPGGQSLEEFLFGDTIPTKQQRREDMERDIAHGAPMEKKAAALETFMASQSFSSRDEGQQRSALNEDKQMMQDTAGVSFSKGKGVENEKPKSASSTLPASEGIKNMQGLQDDYDYPSTFKPQRDPSLKKEKYATPEVLARRPMAMPARRKGTPRADSSTQDVPNAPAMQSNLQSPEVSTPSAEGQVPYVAPQKKQKPHPTMSIPKDLNPYRYRGLGSASALANKPAPPDPYVPTTQESTASHATKSASATPQNPTSGSNVTPTSAKVPASRYAATYTSPAVAPSFVAGPSYTDGLAKGTSSQTPSFIAGPSTATPSKSLTPAPQKVFTSQGQKLLYEGQYVFTGTADDAAYLRESWMNIEDKDVDAFIRRYYRMVHGNGASAVGSPEQNDQESAREGFLVILTKWQNVHQTRVGAGPVESARNGNLVGGKIAIRALATGHATLLRHIATYFDRLIKSCEEEANNLPSHEIADFHKWGEISWMGTVKRDFNFFTAAKERIIHAVKLEQQKREGEHNRFRSQAMGSGGLGGGSSVASTPRLAHASFAASQASTGGRASPTLGPDGRPKEHGFPEDVVVSSDVRAISSRSESSSNSPATANASGGAGGYEVKKSSGEITGAEGVVPL